MMVKRYVVKDMPEAIVMIRRDLGKDAVILSTRKVNAKRWLGLRRQKRLEVLAAAGEDMPIQTRYGGSSNQPSVKGSGSPAEGLDNKSQPRVISQLPHSGTGTEVRHAETAATHSQEKPAVTNREQGNGYENSIHLLQQELLQVRQTLDHLVSQSPVSKGEPDERFGPQHHQFLRKQGLESDKLLSALGVVWGDSSYTASQNINGVSPLLLNAMKEILPQCISSQPLAPSSRVVAFVGQTGVGKTTTIAKVAAMQMLSANKRVGLITADTFRIAAIEQLRTYARILGVPLEVVYRAEEMDTAIQKLADRDLILIDTAGRNFLQPAHFQDIKNLLGLPVIDETHLVLSLTTKAEDLLQCASHFEGLPINKFLFTKLDETSSYGTALELLYRYQRPVSYLTNGQNVPDDLEVATLDKLLKLILEGAA